MMNFWQLMPSLVEELYIANISLSSVIHSKESGEAWKMVTHIKKIAIKFPWLMHTFKWLLNLYRSTKISKSKNFTK